MPNAWVDFVDGSDSNDGLSVGNPKLTFQAALDIVDGGDTLHVFNKGSDTNGPYDWNGGKTTSAGSPIVIKAIEQGGSVEIDHPAETWFAGDLDGDGTAVPLFDTLNRPSDVIFHRMKLHNTGNAFIIDPGPRWHYIGCEIYDNTNGTGLMNLPAASDAYHIGNYYHNGNADAIRLPASGKALYNFIDGIGGEGIRTNNQATVMHNIIRMASGQGGHGIELFGANGQVLIANNLLLGGNTATRRPIVNATNIPNTLIVNNIYDNWAVEAEHGNAITAVNNRWNTSAATGTPNLEIFADLNVDPAYQNAASKNWAVTAAALVNAGFPTGYMGTST